jgi:hypothetical protein
MITICYQSASQEVTFHHIYIFMGMKTIELIFIIALLCVHVHACVCVCVCVWFLNDQHRAQSVSFCISGVPC